MAMRAGWPVPGGEPSRPNGGADDVSQLRGLGVLPAATDAAVLDRPVPSSAWTDARRHTGKAATEPQRRRPLLYSVVQAAEHTGVRAPW